VLSPELHRALVWTELALAALTFFALRFVTAPYGRHARPGWGPTLPARLAWLLMESPAPLLFAALYALGPHRAGVAPLALLALWELHYLYRAFAYPSLLRGGRAMPALVALLAVAFNVLNACVNAPQVSTFGGYPARWLLDPRFVAGAALFLAGLALHVASDRALRRLRAAGAPSYAIPRGGAFEWVSCPNYLGELVEWSGWALATWSLAGLAFALYTAANLAPRALAHHAWYRARFPDYPPRRRALVPFLL
jgi:protein-S-isoprenylcysteine O-methyltransferase Ste14